MFRNCWFIINFRNSVKMNGSGEGTWTTVKTSLFPISQVTGGWKGSDNASVKWSVLVVLSQMAVRRPPAGNYWFYMRSPTNHGCSHTLFITVASRKQNKRYYTKSFISCFVRAWNCLSQWGRTTHRRWLSTGCWRNFAVKGDTYKGRGLSSSGMFITQSRLAILKKMFPDVPSSWVEKLNVNRIQVCSSYLAVNTASQFNNT